MISAALFALLFAGTQELMIPEGTILPVVLNETLNTFTLDFVAAGSINEVNGDYQLHPVIPLK